MGRIPTMTASNLFSYLELLKEDLNSAMKAGDTVKVQRLNEYIENVKMMLNNNFIQTLVEHKDELKVDMALFNLPTLQLAMGGQQLALPSSSSEGVQMKLNLQSNATDATFEAVEDVVIVKMTDVELKEKLEEILSGKFTSYVPNAVSIYNQQTGKKLTPGEAWLEIQKIVNPIKGYKAWHEYLVNTCYEKSPLHAMAYLGRLWKNVPAYEIAEFLRKVCENCYEGNDMQKYYGTIEKFEVIENTDILKQSVNDEEFIKIVTNTIGSEDNKVIKKAIGSYVSGLVALNRKVRDEYIEKGY